MQPTTPSTAPSSSTATLDQPRPAATKRSTLDRTPRAGKGTDKGDNQIGSQVPNRQPRWWWKAIVGIFAWIGRLLGNAMKSVYGRVVTLVAAVLLATAQGQTSVDPRTWTVSISQYASGVRYNLPLDVAVIGGVALLAFASWRAYVLNKYWNDQTTKVKETEAEQQRAVFLAKAISTAEVERDYDPHPQADLAPVECGAELVDYMYVPRVTLARKDADELAREVISALARRRDVGGHAENYDGQVGICVVGPHNSGKSRLVWQALQHPDVKALLSGWTIVAWPRAPKERFRIDPKEKRRYIVLLDRLEQYAANPDPPVTRWLNQLQRDFDENRAPLIVIATCRQLNTDVAGKLPLLLGSLVKIELDGITKEQAEILSADLKRLGHDPYPSDESPLWPGSIVRGPVTPDEYKTLPRDARQVLQVLKLFESAGIGIGGDPPYLTKARICAVADAIFDTPHLRWRQASDVLLSKNLVAFSPTYERAIYSHTGVLDIVDDYPLNQMNELMEYEDWPGLYQVFKDIGDGEAMVALGNAWNNSQLPQRNFPNLPTKLEYLVWAATCFRSALDIQYQNEKEADPFSWARTEWLLGDALTNQNYWMVTTAQRPSRLQVLQEAVAAYQAALTYFDRDTDQDSWCSLTASVGNALNEQVKFLPPEAVDERAARLEEAEQRWRDADEALTEDGAPDDAAWIWNSQAEAYIYRALLATQSEAAEECANRAFDLASKALSRPDALSVEVRGTAQAIQGDVVHLKASLATGEARANLLNDAAKKLREGLSTLEHSSDQDADARSRVKLILAANLLQIARLATTSTEVRATHLQDARQLCEDLLQPVPLDPESLAAVQYVYAGVLVQQAKSASQQEKDELLSKAFDNCTAAYRVPNRESCPDDWAATRYTFAEVTLQISHFLQDTDRATACDYVTWARQLADEALEGYRADIPVFAGERQQTLELRERIDEYAGTLGCSA